MSELVSIIIPARDEPYLQKTIDELFRVAQEDIEVVVCLDGYWPDPVLDVNEKTTLIHHGEPKGMRTAINSAARLAKGKYLMKLDAHCLCADGFDVVLKSHCEEDTTLVPVRYPLDTRKWGPRLHKKKEFEYIEQSDLKGKPWPEFAERVEGQILPELMTFQGSCWFMHRDKFFDRGCLDDVNYGPMGREAQEICLKTWLSGGRCLLDRSTWYAHWSKAISDQSHRKGKHKSVEFATEFWKNDKWPLAKIKLSDLIHRFAPVPTWNMGRDEEVIERIVYENDIIVAEGLTRAGLYKKFADHGFGTGCEVGVQRGRNAWVMLQNIPGLKLHLVEPYKDHPNNRRKWGERIHARFKAQAHDRLKDYDVVWHEGFSERVALDFPDSSLDFVYIDGEHTYDFVMIDILLWSRKVRRGGIVSGHDFEYVGNGNSGRFKNNRKVAEAVIDYTSRYKINPIYLTDKTVKEWRGDGCASWFWFKR